MTAQNQNNKKMKHYLFILFYLSCNVFIYAFHGTFWVYLFCFLFFSAVVVWGSFDIELGYFVNSLTHKRTKVKEVALTFDDGPTEFTPKFLDLLKENQIKATFFCIGKQIEKYPETFQRIIAEGHTVGNHTLSHSNNTGFLSTSKMVEEIEKCDEIISKVGNIKTNLYRPPFGVTNPNIAKAIKRTHKKSIGWNVRSLDTITDNEKKIYKRVTHNLKKGSIILLHDTSEKTYNVLTDLLVFLEREKYSTFRMDTISTTKDTKAFNV
ncbi:Peptidoglycan/xylan/chitin deacetylase, PgdA/CDA1 family [Chryseobacterium polytrichastri]|uniref:Peptidoglycan/xylan/chitin deacetylase, PgdA/CDA1 family n=2 Tax=Chryseobacterium polytrichastri TaxID=1302687 RepID=A0A1M7IN16_9FLAO|nr:Peptidoglycan/xylan/chitin deacetylase, PgdA/CDA1 family [Chryseobacterium polytrichastri]